MNKVRKLAEDLINKHPTFFTADFNANKIAVDKFLVIRNRALRNQIAGFITVMVRENSPNEAHSDEMGTDMETATMGSASLDANEEPAADAESITAAVGQQESQKIEQSAV